MSPRRKKSGLSPEDLQALKHLPAVIRALENLQEQHAKVRALMGDKPTTPRIGAWLPADPAEGPHYGSVQVGGLRPENIHISGAGSAGNQRPDPEASHRIMERLRAEEGFPTTPHNAPPPSAILDTPERREYEAAKKAGKEVPPDSIVRPAVWGGLPAPMPPPDLVNISEAQRERMAEQKALVQQMRRAKGLPVAGEVEPVTEDQVVRTEELPMSESGSVGGEEDPEVH